MLFAPTLNAQFRGAGEIPRDGVCFYQDSNYRGPYFCVEAGSNLNSLPSDVRNQISSIRILGSTEVTVFQETNFRGPSSRFDSDVQSLARTGWNDMISSVRVRSSGFGGGAGGGRPPSFLNPDQIVRRAYQDILERDPDPAGLRAYRSRIVDDGWTEEQVREALRASPEYPREKHDDAGQGRRDRPPCLPVGAQARTRPWKPRVCRPGPARQVDAAGHGTRAP